MLTDRHRSLRTGLVYLAGFVDDMVSGRVHGRSGESILLVEENLSEPDLVLQRPLFRCSKRRYLKTLRHSGQYS